jgi:hypothetical protein
MPAMRTSTRWNPIVELDGTGLRKIISGGQVGADRGAIDAARRLGFPTGGWVPKGWRTYAGASPELEEFGLKEHHSEDYAPRTRLNVVESDGTLIIAINPSSPGCTLTENLCRRFEKPFYHLKPSFTMDEHAKMVEWVIHWNIEVLNVAGNRDKRGQAIPALHYTASNNAVTWLIMELEKRGSLNAEAHKYRVIPKNQIMATAPIQVLIANMLEDSIERLRDDLRPLEQQMKDVKEGMYITHDGERIVVYTSIRFKAYIPKKYDNWEVVFVEWDGQEEIHLDLDLQIDVVI